VFIADEKLTVPPDPTVELDKRIIESLNVVSLVHPRGAAACANNIVAPLYVVGSPADPKYGKDSIDVKRGMLSE
jgi:hypothetical protein